MTEGRGPLLAVWAHPDDETYLMAGIMASAVREGRGVVCVTATKGEAGSQDEERWPRDRIADIRAAELQRALSILGVRDHRWLGYRDGECPAVPDDEAIGKVASIVEEVRPEIVFTFGPDGHTGHPDHVCVHRWTRAAFDTSAPAGARLVYPVVTPEWAERFLPVLEPYDVFAPGTPRIVERAELAVCLELSPELLDLKVTALRAQASQTEGLVQAVGESFFREGLSQETFELGTSR
jgi:LmbE family N-acetylglucosaminyl deacetylase